MSILVVKVSDDNLINTKYEIWKDGSFYTGNISSEGKDRFVKKFRENGHTVINKSLQELLRN